jgi:hypothetical protein
MEIVPEKFEFVAQVEVLISSVLGRNTTEDQVHLYDFTDVRTSFDDVESWPLVQEELIWSRIRLVINGRKSH